MGHRRRGEVVGVEENDVARAYLGLAAHSHVIFEAWESAAPL